jgi:hypothetical protein
MLEKSGAQAQRTFRMIGQLVGGRMGGSAGQVIDMSLGGLSKARSGRTQTRATKLAYDKMNKKDRNRYDVEHEGPPEASGTYNSIMDQFDKAKGGMKGKFEGTERGKKMMENFNAFKGTKKGKALSGLSGAAEAGGKGGMQLVKLAGIGAALAGGAGLGKMIVDSSPMLKAMLKLLNVGIMLILRPIGDFIGFMLRPLLLKFVTKVAIPAYKQGAGLAKEWGTKMSKVLLLLFTSPQEFLKGAILDPLFGMLAKMNANIQRKLMEIAAYLNPMFLFDSEGRDEELRRIQTTQTNRDDPLSDQAINKKYPGFWYDDEGLEGGLLGGMADTDTGKRLEELQQMTTDQLNDVNTNLGTVEQDLTGIDTTDNKILTENQKTNKLLDEMPNKIAVAFTQEDLAQADKALAEFEAAAEKARQDEEDRLAAIAAEEERIRLAEEQKNISPTIKNAGIAIISDAGKKILDKYNEWKETEGYGPAVGVRGGKEGRSSIYGMPSVFAPMDDLGPRAVDSREDAELWSEAFAAAAELGTDVDVEYRLLKEAAGNSKDNMKDTERETDNILTFTRNASGNMEAMNSYTMAMMDGTAGAWVFIKNKLAKMGFNSRNPTGYAGAGPSSGGSGGSGGSGEKSNSQKLIESEAMYLLKFGDGGMDIRKRLNSDGVEYYQKMYASGTPYKDRGPMLSFTKMARGGIISEKIFGIGASTGKGYMFGEAGPETVTPGIGGTVNNRGGSTFNITINASNVGDIERQLKPAILKMLKESTARAGII